MWEMTLTLENNGIPLYEQLYRHIAEEIRAGRLTQGTRLPSKRALTSHLRVSMSTVEGAYNLLISEGYILSRPKKGYFAQSVVMLKPPPERPAAPSAPDNAPAPVFDFSTSAVDKVLFPWRTWSRLFRETLRDTPRLLVRGDSRGDAELRDTLTHFLYQFRGVRCKADNLLVGAGVDYLLYMLFCLFPKGVTVAAEDPGYDGAYRLKKRQGAHVEPIPVDAHGMDLNALSASGAQIAYVTPSHQFPLGLTMPVGRRTELLRWAEEEGHYIIEDDYDSEFRHESRPIASLQGLSGGDRVIYIGTFSRSLAPSMRIAYMALPDDLMNEWHKVFRQGGDSVSRFDQQTLNRFIVEGHYSRHLRRSGAAYSRRCQRLAALFSEIPGALITGDAAGLHFVLTLPSKTEKQLVSGARQAGIFLTGVSAYCHKAPAVPSSVVVGFAGLKDDQLKDAVRTLRAAWDV